MLLGTQLVLRIWLPTLTRPKKQRPPGLLFSWKYFISFEASWDGHRAEEGNKRLCPGADMLCGVCWRAPWPTQPATAGHMALGAWHDSAGLALWPPPRRAPPFPVAGVVSLSQCGGVGFRGGHLPRGAGRPHPRVHPGLLAATAGCGVLWLLSSPPVGAWQSWRGPGGLSGTSSGQTLHGRQQQSGPAQDPASRPLSPVPSGPFQPSAHPRMGLLLRPARLPADHMEFCCGPKALPDLIQITNQLHP